MTKITFSQHTSNLLQAEIKGKKKEGASLVRERDPIATVHTSGGHNFTLYACVAGAVFEVNRRLVDEPGLLSNNDGSSYVCVLRPKSSRRHPASATDVGVACATFKTPDE